VLSGLSDDVILGLLELLPAADLARLGLASKALYCFAHTNDIWKALVLEVGVTWVGCDGISYVMLFAADGCCGSERMHDINSLAGLDRVSVGWVDPSKQWTVAERLIR
jgi:hypothetical protein